MRITFILLLAGFLQAYATDAYSQKTKFSFGLTNVKLVEVLDQIENKSEFYFLYNEKLVDTDRRVNINVKEQNIDEVLKSLFRGTEVSYSVIGRKIVLSLSEMSGSQQKQSVMGKVVDSQGVPLPGTSVVLKGTTMGTVTDVNGNYLLPNVPANATLQFTFVGMHNYEVAVAGKTTINVTLEEESVGIEEVVAVGYGTLKKSDLTGSVARVSMAEKSKQANTNLFQSLVGATAGVNLESRGGSESLPSLLIRGQTSLSASNLPLVVVDGVIYHGSISNINVNDIESIDILKDASAAAVFGSRSANGVLLVTTKKGKFQSPTISFDMYIGCQTMTNNPMRVMNANEFATRLVDWKYQEDVYKWYKTKPTSASGRPLRPDVTNRNVVASYLRTYEEQQNYLAGNEINWVDKVLRIAPMQNYNFGVQGGTKETSYYLSTSYTDTKGIQLNDEFKRLTVRSNVESTVNKWLTLGLNASYSYTDRSGISASLQYARLASPLVNSKIGQNNYDILLGGELFQPYPLVFLHIDNSDISNELFAVGSAKIAVPWVKGLKLETNYSHSFFTRNNNTYNNSNTPAGVNNKGYAEKNPQENRDWIVNNIVTYSREFGKHQVNSTFLFSREYRKGSASTLTAQNFDNELLGYNNMGLGSIANVASSAYEENSLSYMGRINYSFLSRYMLTATVRKDGFSGFGAEKKWALFPSVSFAWTVSKEPFLDGKGLYLKLRTSYGKNGNQGIGRYSSLSQMGTRYYVYGSATAIGLYPKTLGNIDLGWETTSSYNIGTDFGVRDNRISGSIDVYVAKTTDVLVKRQLPRSSGYADVWSNIGEIGNKGVELDLKSINVDRKNFKWESNFTFSLNRDKINKLYGKADDKDIGNSWFIGKPISAIYDYAIKGVWTEDELFNGTILNDWYPGQFKYEDVNSDGVIDPTNDRKIIGYEAPSYRFSINNVFSYKNFSLSFLINSIQGGKKYYRANNADMINPLFYMQERMNNSAINPYWRPDAPTTNTTGIYNIPLRQSGIYQNRSFVRLQEVSLAYDFDKSLLEKLNIKVCQLYVSSKNPYVWTKWKGWDPEIGTSDTPLMRNIILGLKLSF